MSETRPNPLDVTILGTLSGSTVTDQVDKLYLQIKEAHDARSEWINKQERLLRQRRGIRRDKVFPWPGANNHNWPLTDGIIRRWKPGMAGLVLHSDPVSYFFPTKTEAIESARVAQQYYHWKFHHIDGLKRTVLTLLDYVAQHGMAYTRQGWTYRTDRQCRVASSAALFPGGPEAATQQFNAQVEQMRVETEAAVAAGQAPPDALSQVPAPQSVEEHVRTTLEDEYILFSDNPLEAEQLTAAVKAILDGAPSVKFYYRTVVVDDLAWRAISPLDVIVPPRTPNLDEAEFIAVLHRLTADDILKMAVDGVFELDRARTVVDKLRSTPFSDPEKSFDFESVADTHRINVTNVLDKSEGISQGFIKASTTGVLLECYCKLDLDGDGLLEKCVLWYHPSTKTILALYQYPYPFKEWPIVRFDFEHTNERPYSSRGIAELVSVFQAQVNKLHNTRLDASQLTLSPPLQIRSTAGELNRNIKFMPGQMIPVQQPGDIAPVVMDLRGIIQNMQEENLTKGLAEQYIGIFDPSILSQNSSERRTATEVEAVTNQTQAIFGQDALLFQDSMARVHSQLWALLQEFGPPEESFRVTGEDTPRLARRHELAWEFDIVPAGTPANTSKQLAMARAREALQLFLPDLSGLIDRYNLYKWYFDVLDPNMAKRIVRTPDQATLIQQLQQAVAATGQEPAPPP